MIILRGILKKLEDIGGKILSRSKAVPFEKSFNTGMKAPGYIHYRVAEVLTTAYITST
jgi:hypothetical protein